MHYKIKVVIKERINVPIVIKKLEIYVILLSLFVNLYFCTFIPDDFVNIKIKIENCKRSEYKYSI